MKKADVLAKTAAPVKKQKWTEQLVLEVIENAHRLGKIAAADKLAELQKAGPKWAVCQETAPFSGKVEKVVDTMLDVCGFANIRISARGKFSKLPRS